jgi:hypothetical protein
MSSWSVTEPDVHCTEVWVDQLVVRHVAVERRPETVKSADAKLTPVMVMTAPPDAGVFFST